MNLQLSESKLTWLRERIADGTFSSMDDAVERLVEGRMALEEDDLDWARESVEDARREIAEGKGLTLDEHRARNAERLARLRDGA